MTFPHFPQTPFALSLQQNFTTCSDTSLGKRKERDNPSPQNWQKPLRRNHEAKWFSQSTPHDPILAESVEAFFGNETTETRALIVPNATLSRHRMNWLAPENFGLFLRQSSPQNDLPSSADDMTCELHEAIDSFVQRLQSETKSPTPEVFPNPFALDRQLSSTDYGIERVLPLKVCSNSADELSTPFPANYRFQKSSPSELRLETEDHLCDLEVSALACLQLNDTDSEDGSSFFEENEYMDDNDSQPRGDSTGDFSPAATCKITEPQSDAMSSEDPVLIATKSFSSFSLIGKGAFLKR